MINVREYIGIPFLSRGRTKYGLDCWGLVAMILKEQYDIIVPDLLEYNDALNRSETSEVININTPLVAGEKLTNPVEGSVVVLSAGGLSAHVGLVIGGNMIIHTTKETGVLIEPLSSPRIKKRIKGYYSVSKNYCTKQSI